MGSDDKQTFKLDLDSADFIKKSIEAKESISKIGESGGMEGLIKNLSSTSLLLGMVGAAAFSLKETFELVFEGENIRAVNKQFEMLGESAGIATGALREGLKEAAGGLEDETELLKSANKAMIEMGQNASRLPETLALARKATAIFGGELTQNFESINEAISTGHTRQLRHLGLIVDANKAYIEYAKSIGTTVGALSEEGKQHALMEAVLQKGQDRFKGIDADSKQVTVTFKQLGVIIEELREKFAATFEKTVGPMVKNVLDYVKLGLEKVSVATSAWGENLDVTKAQVENLTETLFEYNKRIKELAAQQKEGPSFWDKLTGTTPEDIEATKKKLQEKATAVQAEINGLKNKMDQQSGEAEGPKIVGPEVDQSKKEKQLEQQAKFEKDLVAIKSQRINDEMKNAESIDEVDKLHNELNLVEEEKNQSAIQEIKARYAHGEITAAQENQLIEENNLDHIEKMQSMEDNLDKQRLAALDNYLQRSNDTSEGIARGFSVGGQKAVIALNDFGARGQRVFNTVSNNAAKAFIQMGEGTKTAGEAMKGFMFASIADIAEAEGKLLLAKGIGTANPASIAAGGALLALSGLLRAQSGGGSSSAGGGGGGAAGPGGGEAANTSITGNKPDGAQLEHKTVTLAVGGNFFETEQTKQSVMEMIRQATDATDFKYTQIGKG